MNYYESEIEHIVSMRLDSGIVPASLIGTVSTPIFCFFTLINFTSLNLNKLSQFS